jgi:hypothetical protein
VHYRHPKNAQLADEAVQLDPKLTWVYFDMAARDPENPEAGKWISALRAWDPDNATSYLLEADRIAEAHHLQIYRPGITEQTKNDAQWLSAMAHAFAAPKYDSYINEQLNLDREVFRGGHLEQPVQALGIIFALPIPNSVESKQYSQYLLERGQQAEAANHLKEAESDYWAVARFGQRVQAGAKTDFENYEAWSILEPAYQRLQADSEKDGNSDESGLFAYLVTDVQRSRANLMTRRLSGPIYTQYALAVEAASIALIFSIILLAASGGYLLAARAWRRTSDRASRVLTSGLSVPGAIGILASSCTLYLSYRPFAEIFSSYMSSDQTPDLRTLWAFVAFLDLPYYFPVKGVLFSGLLLALAAGLLVVETVRLCKFRLWPQPAVKG